jgi:hypothetical protein
MKCLTSSKVKAARWRPGFSRLKPGLQRCHPAILALLFALAAVCLDHVTAAPEEKSSAKIVIDKEKRTITVPAKVAPRKIDDPRYKEIYPIEVIATFPFPRGKKSHETVVTVEAKPSEVHKALESFGLKPGKPARTLTDVQTGPQVKIGIAIGKARPVPVERFLVDNKTGKPMPAVKWLFTGSLMLRPNPDKPEVYGADETGTLVAIFPVTAETVFQSSLSLADEKYVKLETNDKLPKIGTPVNLVITAGSK